ncbi:hypothetical protein ANCCAN_05069 [Ancylostoma caninum]|uniref:Uncharacterized protein n=1 Tax=Ancylostoma caninum TaxID=29170 RepID=A0A368GWQ1_ANCCA|nr:hypothetical protein ANCCAN_05069 [Ancylostoma caninum]
MHRLITLLVFYLILLTAVEARREKIERAPLYEVGDLCTKYCPALGGWDRCEKRRAPLQWELKCIDNRQSLG